MLESWIDELESENAAKNSKIDELSNTVTQQAEKIAELIQSIDTEKTERQKYVTENEKLKSDIAAVEDLWSKISTHPQL